MSYANIKIRPLFVVAAVVGWAAIELVLWLFSFVTISIG